MRYLCGRGADVVHTQLEFADGLARWAARLAGLPSLSTLHTMYESPRWSRSWLRNRLGDASRSAASPPRSSASPTRPIATRGDRLYPRRKLVTLRNGIDLARFGAAAGEGPAVRREPRHRRRRPVLASVSVLRRDKGIQHMIAALLRLSRRRGARRRLPRG